MRKFPFLDSILQSLPILGSLAFLWIFLGIGWLPWDDGMLGQMAVRVLGGEMPHRDFVDPYTGLLTFLNAFIFRLFGTDLLYLRWPLYLVSIVFSLVLYRLFRLFIGPRAASWSTAGSIVATMPNYFVALPSWYMLFFSGFSFFFIVRWIRVARARYLFIAGFFLGLASLIKINGIFLAYGAILAIIYSTSLEISRNSIAGDKNKSSFYPFILSLSASLAGILGIGSVVYPRLSVGTAYLFLVPVFIVCLAPLYALNQNCATAVSPLLRNIFLTFGGFASIWIPFLIYIYIYGDLYLWWIGVFVTPRNRFIHAAISPQDIILIFIPLIVLMRRFSRRDVTLISTFLGIILITLGLFEPTWSGEPFSAYHKVIWPLMLGLTPYIICQTARFAISTKIPPHERSVIFAICCWATFWNLNQYPYTGSGYLLYSVIPILLCTTAISRDTVWGTPSVAIPLWGSAALAMMLGVLPRIIPFLPLSNPGKDIHTPLAMKGASILVSKEDHDRYHWLIPEIQKRSGSGEIFGFPEQPHLYFLAEKKNISPFLYEMLGMPGGGNADLLHFARDERVRAVITWESTLNDNVGLYFKSLLLERFPNTEVGHGMVILWR